MLNQPAKYNPAFLGEEKLVESFVARHTDLSLILDILKENIGQPSNQHVLLIGQRGTGKTTLALRVAAEVKRDDELKNAWFPLVFAEESYQVATPGEFWLEAIFHLGEKTGDKRWKRAFEQLRGESDENRLRERALSQLMDFADSIGRRLLLIVENLDMLLADQLGKDEAWVLRHTFLNEPRIMMLATAIRRVDEIGAVDKAMYELFKVYELRPLDSDECRAIWKSITGKEISELRARPIRILTGGNPRLLAIISSFGANMSFRELMTDLMQLVDEHTEYFKSHLDNLAPVERKVYLALAELWDPSPAREVAAVARLDVNKTSSLLSRLVERGAVEVVEGGKRTKWYQLSERMYNIYNLMRRRGAPSSRVQAVVDFMVSFYDEEELLNITKCIATEACKLPSQLKEYNYFAYKSIVERMADRSTAEKFIKETPAEFLEPSNIPESFDEEFIFRMREPPSISGKRGSAKAGVKHKLELLLSEAEKLSKEPRKVIESLELFKRATGMAPDIPAVWIKYSEALQETGKYIEAEQACRKAVEINPQSPWGWVQLGHLLHEKLERYDEAEQAYRKALEIDPEYRWGWAHLGLLLHEKLGRYDEAEMAYRKALEIDPQHVWAWAHLGQLLHEKLGRHDEAEQAINTAFEIRPKVAVGWIWIGKFLYNSLKKPHQAEIAFTNALAFKPLSLTAVDCMMEIYVHGKRPERIVDFFIEHQDLLCKSSPALHALAFAYYVSGHKEHLIEAEEWARKAIAISPENACYQHTLASLLAAQGRCDAALEPAKQYLSDPEVVRTSLEAATDLMVALAAQGYAEKALDILSDSPASELLEPLIAGIRLYLGRDVRVATEILEVGKDVAIRIERRREAVKPREVASI